ncbi:MAG: protein kinase domain-containing protein [Vulcanimicrobiota bacterium]
MLLVNTVFHDKYKILKKLESGSYGEVYKGLDLELNREVAIKEIRPADYLNDKDLTEAGERFFEEIDFLKSLNHDNLVNYYEAFYEEENFYYVSEWIEGQSLKNLLVYSKKRWGEKQAVKILYSLSNLIKYFNSLAQVFNLRYISLEDVVVDSEGVPIVVDLGSAALLNPRQLPGDVFIPDEEPGPRLDIFFLGLLIYHMFTGKKTGKYSDIKEIPHISTEAEEVSKAFSDIIHRCVATLDKRYYSIGELQGDIIKWYPEYTMIYESSETKTLEEIMNEKEKKTRFTYAGCLFSIIIIAILVNLYYPAYVKYRAQQQLGHCTQNIDKIVQGLQKFKEIRGKYPEGLQELVPKYLDQLPACPAAGNELVYIESYKSSDSGKDFIFFCKGEHHESAGIPENFPMYSSYWGLRKRPVNDY